MREIKFKVFYKYTDEYFKGLIEDQYKGSQYIDLGITELELQKRSLGLMIENDAVQDIEDTERLIFRQYTGLNDVNGVEIYEGDVIEFRLANSSKRVKGFIKWYDTCFSFFCVIGQFPNQHTKHLSEIYDIKVLGNIYQNSELLKGVS